MKKHLFKSSFLAIVCCLSSVVLFGLSSVRADPILAGAAIEIPADAGTRFSGLEGRTSIWNKAATDGSTSTSAIPRIAAMEGRTGTWNQAATDGASATGAVAVIQAGTSTWNQAATDASSWTNAQAAALKSVTNSWTDTNGIPWYVVLSANGMITHWSTNAP